jgi:hypothetical protein
VRDDLASLEGDGRGQGGGAKCEDGFVHCYWVDIGLMLEMVLLRMLRQFR